MPCARRRRGTEGTLRCYSRRRAAGSPRLRRPCRSAAGRQRRHRGVKAGDRCGCRRWRRRRICLPSHVILSGDEDVDQPGEDGDCGKRGGGQ